MADIASITSNPYPSLTWTAPETTQNGKASPEMPGSAPAGDEVELSPEAKKYQEKLEGKSEPGKSRQGEAKLDEATQREVDKLKQIEQHVMMHEAAHMAAGGGMAGAPHYEYTVGPDGKRYIVGGEVSIRMNSGGDPREVIANMQQVQRAAMAPSDPSSQDQAVAAQAAQIEAQARAELAAEKPGGDTSKTASKKGEDPEAGQTGRRINLTV